MNYFILLTYFFIYNFLSSTISAEDPPGIGDYEFIILLLQDADNNMRIYVSPKLVLYHKFIEAKLGNMFLLKQKWKCENLDKQFTNAEQKECEKYLRFLEIFYEYCFRLYIQVKPRTLTGRLSTFTKPEFCFDKRPATIGEVLFILHRVHEFFFDPEESQLNKFQLRNQMIMYKQLELRNEKDFEGWAYVGELPEIRKWHDQRLKKMAEETTEMTKTQTWTEIEYRSSDLSNVASQGTMYYISYNPWARLRRIDLIAIMKEESTVFIGGENICVEYLDDEQQKGEIMLGIAYLMQKNWQCEKISPKFGDYEKKECQRFGNYAHMLYEYLFRQYIQEKYIAKPLFKGIINTKVVLWPMPLGEIFYSLSNIALFYFDTENSAENEYKLANVFKKLYEPVLGKGLLKNSNETEKDKETFDKKMESLVDIVKFASKDKDLVKDYPLLGSKEFLGIYPLRKGI